jgi:hypothetical protein
MRFWYWLMWRTMSRCYAQGCGLWMVLHSHKRMLRCIDTPMSIRLADLPDTDWQVVPVSHAQA